MNRYLAISALSFVLGMSLFMPTGRAGINSLDIAQDSISFSCIDWQPTGVCFWLRCSAFPPSCSVNTSLRVRHYNPDAVVQVYQTPGDVPWDEMSFVSKLVSLGQTANTPATLNQRGGAPRQSSKIISRHVDVIGSPGLLPVSELFGSTEYGCESGVTPFIPYYVSTLDYYSWKHPYVEALRLATIVPGMREVGERRDGENETFLFTGRFGNVYPRIGSLMQNDSYKASAVFAQRAADIVTDSSAFHVYNFLGEQGGWSGWWPPGQVKEWTSRDGKWQQLYPYKDSGCHIFGEPSTRRNSVIYDGYQHRRSNDGNYAWQLWRPYECCERKGQTLLFVVEF